MAKNKPRPTKGRVLRELIGAITGRRVDDDRYIGKKIYSRKIPGKPQVCGEITNTSICGLDGCGGTRLHAKWPDGRRTYPCAKGCKVRKNGDLEIE